ncbi:hypothetical protein TNCV_569961 [Trichonephila clavipes]|nr:hypothetical protein TNCV_569961 [Trichonephila clavipes]
MIGIAQSPLCKLHNSNDKMEAIHLARCRTLNTEFMWSRYLRLDTKSSRVVLGTEFITLNHCQMMRMTSEDKLKWFDVYRSYYMVRVQWCRGSSVRLVRNNADPKRY